MNAWGSLVRFLQQAGVWCVCVRPVVRRNPWLALRLSRPEVIQLNAVSVVMATCVLHTAALRQDERGCLDWQITGKQRKAARREKTASSEPLRSTTTTESVGLLLVFIKRGEVQCVFHLWRWCTGLICAEISLREQTHTLLSQVLCNWLLPPTAGLQSNLGSRRLCPHDRKVRGDRYFCSAGRVEYASVQSVLRFRLAPETKRMDKEKMCVCLHFSFPVCNSQAYTPLCCQWMCVCACVCVRMFKVLTQAAGPADICLCLSDGGTNCNSLSLSASAPSALSAQVQTPSMRPHTHTHTHTLTHTLFQHREHIPYLSVCTSKPPHPGPPVKRTELQVDVALLTPGQTLPHPAGQLACCNHGLWLWHISVNNFSSESEPNKLIKQRNCFFFQFFTFCWENLNTFLFLIP